MPAKSEKQRKAAGMALAMKRGKMPMKKGAAREMAKMPEKSLRHFASKPKTLHQMGKYA